MNRSGNTRFTDISASFHENVFLLTQMVPPSLEFQQHFKKNMFDKPNTAGFLHVSHYLSVVYDAKLFKRMVKWPLLCKKDEIVYRNEMRNFLSVLSQDNQDINFPTILTFHLTQAGGAKFLITMWKVSQLALRAYIKRQYQEKLLSAPHTGLMDNLTITYFNSIIAERCRVAKETHKEAKRILGTASNFLKSEIELQNMYKSEIFDRTQNIKRLVSDMSVHSLVQEQLLDVEDSNIINSWCFLGIHLDEQRVSQKKVTNIPISLDMNDTFIPNRDVLLELSPEINFDLDQCANDDYFYKTLCPSLKKDKHKYLFKRYKRKYYPKERIVASSGSNDSSWNNLNGWLSPRAYSFKSKPANEKSTSPLHSRLLHYSQLSPKRFTGNAMHSPNSIYERSTLKKYRSVSGHLISSRLFDGKARNLFNSSMITSLYIS